MNIESRKEPGSHRQPPNEPAGAHRFGAPRILVAGTHSGAGKTTVTLGLMAAFARRRRAVQGFKAGPDYIDPGFHTAVTGRPSRNLDTWMLDKEGVREVFGRSARNAELSIIEGVMGLFDGKEADKLTGSTAELAMALQAPVLLVVDASGMARSAAAVVLGYQRMEPDLRLAGVIVNGVGSDGHYAIVKTAIEAACDVPVIGCLPQDAALKLPERHLGLVPAVELADRQPAGDGGDGDSCAGWPAWAAKLADVITEHVDLDQLLRIARGAPVFQWRERLFRPTLPEHAATIAVARDEAFHFYYPENLELLELAGAKLLCFRPLDGERIPAEADGLYMGGGFPEEFAERLSLHRAMLADLRQRILAGLPTVAECGGYMLLAEAMTDRAGRRYAMAGVIPAEANLQPRLAALGYREAAACIDGPALAKGEIVRGHEFHYSVMHFREGTDHQPAYAANLRGNSLTEGFALPNLTAGYTHLYFASNPGLARRFVASCSAYRAGRNFSGGGRF